MLATRPAWLQLWSDHPSVHAKLQTAVLLRQVRICHLLLGELVCSVVSSSDCLFMCCDVDFELLYLCLELFYLIVQL